MATQLLNQSYAEEKLVWRALVGTYIVYLLGALYVTGSILGWALLLIITVRTYVLGKHKTFAVPAIAWVWVLAMFVMLIALWIGHADWYLGTGKTIKSSIGWAKGWALLALFPLVGAILPIRRELLTRAQCVLGLWTLAIAPLLLVAPYIGLPERIFTSPLKAVGGPGPEYFTVFLFTWDPASWTPRWQFYAPWSPFAALLGVVMVLFALEEKNRRWMWCGLLAGVLLVGLLVIGASACTASHCYDQIG